PPPNRQEGPDGPTSSTESRIFATGTRAQTSALELCASLSCVRIGTQAFARVAMGDAHRLTQRRALRLTGFRSAALKPVVSANGSARLRASASRTRAWLFDIVNVQNWPAAPRLASIAVVPVARSLPFLRGAAADHLAIFAGLAEPGRAPPS